MPWYHGPDADGLPRDRARSTDARCSTSRSACRCSGSTGPNLDFRGFAGTIASGAVEPGRRASACCPRAARAASRASSPSTATSTQAVAGQSVTLTLDDEIDVSPRRRASPRADAPPEVADQFEAHHRLDERRADAAGPAVPAEDRHAARSTATVTELKYKVNVNTLEHLAAKTLELNEIGVCNVALDQPIAFDPYADNRDTGGFILIDRLTNAHGRRRHAALRAAPRRRTSTGRRSTSTRRARAALKGQKPVRAVVHRPVGRGQVDHRQPGREEAARAWAATPTCSTATTCATA